MTLKKTLIAFLLVISSCIVNAKTVAPYDMVLNKRPTSYITQSSLLWDAGSPWLIFFEVGIDQANSVDYRVVVGVWMYVNGFYNCGQPRNCAGWHWQYRYYSIILPAGQTYTNTNIGGGYMPVNSGEQVDNSNWYISFYGPN